MMALGSHQGGRAPVDGAVLYAQLGTLNPDRRSTTGAATDVHAAVDGDGVVGDVDAPGESREAAAAGDDGVLAYRDQGAFVVGAEEDAVGAAGQAVRNQLVVLVDHGRLADKS